MILSRRCEYPPRLCKVLRHISNDYQNVDYNWFTQYELILTEN